MAGHVRKLGPGRYQARFPVGGRGRFRSRTFQRKVDADSWLREQNRQHDRGEWLDPRAAREPFGAVAAAWLASRRGKAASTRARDESVLRSLVVPHLGDLELRHVTPERLVEWIGVLDDLENKAPSTVTKAYQLLALVLDQQVEFRKLAANPARVPSVRRALPHGHGQDMRFLNANEVQALADALPKRDGQAASRYRALILTAAYAGLRWGELAGLRAKHVDLNAQSATVAEALTEVRGKLGFKPPKSAASRRKVQISDTLTTTLTDHLTEWPAVGDEMVFTAAEGGPLRRNTFRSRVWVPTVQRSVGLPLRFHDMRHTHAAFLIAEGFHPKVIQARLGHASISTTLDTYGHLFDGFDHAVADRLDTLQSEAEKHSGSTPAPESTREPADKRAETLDE